MLEPSDQPSYLLETDTETSWKILTCNREFTMIEKRSLHAPAEMWRLLDLATYKTSQDYVWNRDVILNHMTFTFVFLNKAFFATSLIIDFFRHLRRCFDSIASFGGKRKPFLIWCAMWTNMAVAIGNGRYYKLFRGNSAPKRLLIGELNEPGLLSSSFIQGLCKFSMSSFIIIC